VQSDCLPDLGEVHAAPLSERNPGPHLREAAQSEGTRMLSVINPDLLWLALGFILSMAGMLATYPE
jgi:hypothetical protein